MERRNRAHGASLFFGVVALVAGVTSAPAQDGDDMPPGISEREGRLGPAIGSSGITSFDSTPGAGDQPIGSRPGPSVSRAPRSALEPPGVPERERPGVARPRSREAAEVPRYGELELPSKPEEAGPPGGLTLDAAIERLVRQNLNLLALRHEIDQADADILTASLRANPSFYADTQMVPYGNYNRARQGGPTQYDVNITFPLDVTRKRLARTDVARKAKLVAEAQLQDAVRLEIDNLYTAFVDVAAAKENLRYSKAYGEGIGKLLELNRELLKKGQITEESVDALQAQAKLAQFQIRESTQAHGRTIRALAVLLNIPRAHVDALEVSATLRSTDELPMPMEQILQLALSSRPDLNAYRLGVSRADADVKLAHAERMSDVFVMAQPYTFQDNRAYGLKSPTSWAVGVTVPLPIFNRNQGNIARARSNSVQTRTELAAIERQVASEAEEAVREFELSREGVLELEGEIIPASRRVRDSAFRRFQGGEANALEYLEAQRQYNDAVRDYHDALVRHRRSMLDLNTAVGVRILP